MFSFKTLVETNPSLAKLAQSLLHSAQNKEVSTVEVSSWVMNYKYYSTDGVIAFKGKDQFNGGFSVEYYHTQNGDVFVAVYHDDGHYNCFDWESPTCFGVNITFETLKALTRQAQEYAEQRLYDEAHKNLGAGI